MAKKKQKQKPKKKDHQNKNQYKIMEMHLGDQKRWGNTRKTQADKRDKKKPKSTWLSEQSGLSESPQ